MHVAWLHYFMAGFFTIAGWWFVTNRSCVATFDPFCRALDDGDEAATLRLAAAYRRRVERERSFGGKPGLVLGSLAFALAALAGTTSLPVATLYAVFVVALAAVTVVASGLVRRSHRRVASLVVRKRDDAIPTAVVALAGVAALVPLVWLPAAPGASIAVAVSGLAIVALGLRVATAPVELEGDDRVEAFVDRRVRVARVAGLFAIAPAPAFVFASFSGWTDTWARVVALAVAFAACAVACWRLRDAIRTPSAGELDAWLHVAP